MTKNTTIEKMWNNYLDQLDSQIEKEQLSYEAWHFCADEKNANELAELTNKGIKRATTSLHYDYEVEGDEIPKEGDLSIITDWEGNAVCIIKTTKVMVMPFKDVSEEFAYREGEGDKTLGYWKRVHNECYVNRCKEMNIEFNEDMLVVLEEFEKVY